MPSIKKNFLHNLLFLLSNILFPLVSFSYVSRILGPEGYGKIQFIVVFAQYFIIIAAFGIPIFGVREIAKVSHSKSLLSKLFSELLFINILSSLLLLGIYLTIIFTFNWFQDDLNLYFLGGLLVLTSFSTLDWFYNGVEQFHFLSIRSITIKVISLIALFLFVKTKNNLVIYFLIIIFSVIGNNIWNLIKIRKLITFRFKQLNLRRHLPVLATLFITTISISIYTIIDTLLLGFLTDDISVGYYSAAVKINKIAIPLVVALGTVLIPRITQSIVDNDRALLKSLIDKSFAFICLLGIPISFGLFLFAPEFILSLSGSQFEMAILTTRLAAPLALLIGLGHLFGFQLLIPAGLEKKYLIATIAGMFISITLNLVLIPIIKDKGAAIATVASEMVVTIISFYYVYKKMTLNINWSLAVKSALSCLVFIPIAYFLRRYQSEIILRLLMAIISSTFLYFLIQIIIFKNTYVKEIYRVTLLKVNRFLVSIHTDKHI